MPTAIVSTLRRWANLLDVLKYAVFLALLLAWLPLTAYRWVPGHSLLGGLFAQLDGWGIFWVTFGLFASSWSLMSCVGLLIDGAQVRERADATFEDSVTYEFLPELAVRFLSLPVTRGWLRAATLFAVLLSLVVVHVGLLGWKGLVPAAMGWLCSYLLMVALTVPAQLVDPEFSLLPRSLLAQRLRSVADVEGMRRVARALRRAASWFSWRVLRMHYVLTDGKGADAGRRVLQTGHFLALMNLLGLSLLLVAVGVSFFPPTPWIIDTEPPAAAYLYLLLTLNTWLILGLDAHLARLHISPVLVLVLVLLLRPDADHYFDVHEQLAPESPLTPVTVAESSRAARNLVVVASSGGGILSAGWTTLALRNLISERPQLAEEIRLLSTISGGSTGAAFFLDGVEQAGGDLSALQESERRRVLENVYCRATHGSLSPVAYGFALVDFWRVFTGRGLDLLFTERWHGLDRARLQEDAWGRIAAYQWQSAAGETSQAEWGCRPADVEGPPRRPRLSSLRAGIREGRLPAPIFSTTVMENGHRIMLTPMAFEEPVPGQGEPLQRARTLSGFLGYHSEPTPTREADLDLWSAARLSATFPYVSPAARARVYDGKDVRVPEGQHGLHFLDGGYYDNSGLTSTLDWLQPVLEDLLRRARAGEAVERRVLLLELTPFSATDSEKVQPVTGGVAALFGPLIGDLKLREGITTTRNVIERDRFLANWNREFAQAGVEVCLQTVTFRPPPGAEQPLSWRLTPEQIEQQIATWPDMEGASEEIRRSWRSALDFLNANTCPLAG